MLFNLKYTKNDIFYTIFGFCLGYCAVFWMTIGRFAQKPKNCSRPLDPSTSAYNYKKPDKAFLLVAVMTTRYYLETRARYVHETWGHRVPGDILYFVGDRKPYTGDLPVITLNHINDKTYPPQKKSFSMIKYLSTDLLSRYEWFMRADDDVFVKTFHLEKFLRTINSSKTIYLGQPGFGLKHERGKLGLHGAFCMGGPGVLLTKSMLYKVSRHIVKCVDETVTAHEDTELGRCIQKYVGVRCTIAYEFKQTFINSQYGKYTQYNKSFGRLEEKALTLHPIKIFPHMYRLDALFSALKVKQLQNKLFLLNTEKDKMGILLHKLTEHQKLKKATPAKKLRNVAHHKKKRSVSHIMAKQKASPNKITENVAHISRKRKVSLNRTNRKISPNKTTRKPSTTAPTKNKPKVHAESPKEWDMFNNDRSLYSRYNFSTSGKYIFKLNADIAVKYGSKFKYPVIPISYLRVIHGKEVETVSIKRGKNKKFLLEKTTQYLSGAQFYDLRTKPQPPIWIILPVYKKSQVYKNFIAMISKVIIKYRGKINLVIVLMYDSDGEYLISKIISKKLTNISKKLTHKIIFLKEPFSRGLALSKGIAHLTNNTLLVFMGVEMIFDEHFLYRVQANTIYGKQVYFPIYFSQYNPRLVCFKNRKCRISSWNFGDDYGMWRMYGFGIVSIYKGDYARIGGHNLNIRGWNEEDDDEDFYDKIIRSHLCVFRAVDPTLVHVYHQTFCDRKLPQTRFLKCQLAHVLGNSKQLTTLVSKLKLVNK